VPVGFWLVGCGAHLGLFRMMRFFAFWRAIVRSFSISSGV